MDVHLNPERLPDDVDRPEAAGAPDDDGPGEAPDEDGAGEAPDDGQDDLGLGGGLALVRDDDPAADPEPASPVAGTPEPSPDHAAAQMESAASASPAGAPGGESRTCSWCRETLPDREKLNFCPFCGTDVDVVPCPSCGEALEPGWLFCIACGASVTEG